MDFQKRVLKVVIVCLLATIWVISFAASARLARDGRFEHHAVTSVVAAGSSTVMDSPSLPLRDLGVSQANPSTALQRSVVSDVYSRIGTALAIVAFVVPFGFSILSILWVQGAQRRQSPRWLGILFSIRRTEHAA
jgi:hypothetical protein